jgi:hypothetical protein
MAPAAAGDGSRVRGPQDYLEFLDQQDGKCYNLSQGGQLRLLKNSHASQRIRFRLVRYFSNVKQPGLVQGVIEPRDQFIALGCTLVDGRQQRWEIETASFVD